MVLRLQKSVHKISLCSMIGLFSMLASSTLAAGLSYQGRVFNSQNAPLTASGVEFTLNIRGPMNLPKPCVLYTEKFTVNMTSGDGSFSVITGDGQRMDPSQVPLEKIFNANLTFPNLPQCEGGYTKAAGDRLYLQVSFNDGSGLQNLDPVELTPSPYALETFNVGGVPSSSVLRLSDGPAAPFTLTSFNELLALANGTSTKYYSSSGTTSLQIKASSGSEKITLVAPTGLSSYQLTLPSTTGTSGQVLTTNGSGVLSWSTVSSGGSGGGGGSSSGAVGGDLSGTLPNPTVAKINGQAVSATTPTTGQVLYWNGSAYSPTNFGMSHLRSTTGLQQFPAVGCSASQTLSWTSLTDSFTCNSINGLSAGAITSGTIDSARLPSSALLWTDGGSGKISYSGGNVGVGTTNPELGWTNLIPGTTGSTYFTLAGGTANIPALQVWRDTDTAYGSYLNLVKSRNGGSVIVNDELGYLNFGFLNSASKYKVAGSIVSTATSVTDGAESGSLIFRTSNAGTVSNAMTIFGSKVGIGTNSPISSLDVVSTGNGISKNYGGFIQLNNLTRQYSVGVLAADSTSFGIRDDSAAGTPTRISIDGPSGNIGIGTTSPNSVLSIGSNIGTGYALTASSTTAYGSVIQTSQATPTSNAALWVRTTPDSGTTVNSLFRVQNNGKVGVGSDTPAVKLDVAGAIKVGNETVTCNSGNAGVMKFVSSNLMVCDGTSWKVVQLTTPVANVVLISGTGTGMNVTGPGNPGYGTAVVFTFQNSGTADTVAITTSLSSTTNFEITADTCSGVILTPSSTCSVTVRPKATSDGSLSSNLVLNW